MKKRSLAILVIAVMVGMLSFNVSAAATETIVVSPAEGLDVTWSIVKCDHVPAEALHVYSTLGIGWTKGGDIVKLVDQIDFGKGLVSLKVVTTCAEIVPDGSKCVIKAGDVIIAEIIPVKTASWDDTIELTATLKEPITGKQNVTVEFVGVMLPVFGDMTFEVTPNTIVASNAATASTTSALTTSAVSNAPTSLTSSTPTKTATLPKASPTAVKIESNSKNYTGVIVGIVCVVLALGGATAFILLKKKK